MGKGARTRGKSKKVRVETTESDRVVYSFAIVSYADPQNADRMKISVIPQIPMTESNLEAMAKYLFGSTAETLKLPEVPQMIVAYDRPVQGDVVLHALSRSEGIWNIPGCTEVRVRPGSGVKLPWGGDRVTFAPAPLPPPSALGSLRKWD